MPQHTTTALHTWEVSRVRVIRNLLCPHELTGIEAIRSRAEMSPGMLLSVPIGISGRRGSPKET